MTYKVGAKGQVVLPKELRERHGIRPGDEVLFDERDGEITVRKAKSKAQLVDELMGSLAGSDLLEAYAEGKRREREREERKYGSH